MTHSFKTEKKLIHGIDHSISQSYGLPYRSYSENDSEAIKLLSLFKGQDHSLEYSSKNDEWIFIVYDKAGLFGETCYGKTMRESIIAFFRKRVLH